MLSASQSDLPRAELPKGKSVEVTAVTVPIVEVSSRDKTKSNPNVCKKRMLISITIYFGLEIERMENFHNDCCRPGTKNLFKNSHSRR